MISQLLLLPNNTVKEAIRILDEKDATVIFIVDSQNKLLGIFTKGDMRRYILQNGNLQVNITEAMNSHPIVFESFRAAENARKDHHLAVYPVVNEKGILVDALFDQKDVFNAKVSNALIDVPLVIMAGGMGTRLYPYTKILPKALMPIGDLSITERIIENFTKWGCKEVYLILNHKANMIKSYFEELEKNYNIHYIQEEKFLGTGGGLSLLKDKIKKTFILSNCDILVNTDFECVMKTHAMKNNVITFVGAMKEIVIPYGVISTDADGKIEKMQEKPEFSFLTNTGVYIINPKVIYDLNENEYIHITNIAQRYMDKGDSIGVFPISEKNWLDMGQFNEMEIMLKELGISG